MSSENNKSKRIAKNTLLLYFRMMFLMCITLYTSRVVLEALGVTDYGIYNVVGGFVSLFSLVSASLTNASSRFLNFEMGKENVERLKNTFSTTVTIQLILACIVAILCETGGLWYINNVMVLPAERLTAANWCFQISIITFCLNLIMIPYNAAIIAHEKMSVFAYISLFDGIAKLIICYVIMYSGFDKLIFYAILLLVIQIIDQLVYQTYCRKKFDECVYHPVVDKILLKNIFSYASWHLIGNGSSILKNQGVDMVLNYFFGPVVNASKGVASRVLSAVQGFASNFMMAINPQITQSYAKGDFDYCFNLVYKGARFSFYILFIISLPIIINADFLLRLWLVEVPEYATIFVQLSIVLSLMATWSNTLITLNNATGKVKNYQVIVGGIQLLNLPIVYILFVIGLPPYTSILVAIVVESICLLARLYMNSRIIPHFKGFEYLNHVVFRCIVIAFLSSIFPYILHRIVPMNLIFLLLHGAISILFSSAIVYFYGLTFSERYKVRLKICNLLKKIRATS